jgi:hypothetical protein
MTSGYDDQVTNITIFGGTAILGTATLPIFKVPFGGATIKAAELSAQDAVAANGSNYVTFTLLDGGSAGTATTAIGTAGGTAGVVVAPTAFTLNTALDELDSGDYLMAKMARTGSTANNTFNVTVTWARGKG